jgi:uncharacterized protein YkwD
VTFRCRRLFFLLALLIAGTSYGEQGKPAATDEVARLIIDLTNEFRVEHGRNKVAADARLTEAARYFARYIAKTGRFSHGADGMVPASRAQKHGYDYCIISENLAYREVPGPTPPRELAQGLVEGWKKSPGHRKNMLEPEVTDMGAAVARNKRGAYYAVQMFGRPVSRAVKFSLANRTNTSIRYRIDGREYALVPRQARTHTQCRLDEVRIDWPGEQRNATIRPKDGERLAIVRSDTGGFSLKPE